MDQISSENELKIYYRKIFPTELIFKNLDINPRREVSFFTKNGNYIRYLTFSSVDAFKEKLEQVNPIKIDLGPVYDIPPAKSNGAVPVLRELVFDIDLTDYPRDCCKEKTVCKKCYEKIKCAVKILDYILKNEFGFKKYGFAFSGRRGVHCWVLEMKDMPKNIRNDIYKYFAIVIDKHLSNEQYDKILFDFDTVNPIDNFFPRIDKQVTVSMNHLIKVPFSVHPETMNISVPLDPQNITELDDIPTLFEVVEDPKIMEKYYEIFKRWADDE